MATVPNAVNSPFRNMGATSGKRTRAQAGETQYGLPPSKKHIIEIKDEDAENVDPKRRAGVTVSALEKLEEPFGKRSNPQPTAFDKKLAAARDKRPNPPQQPRERPQKSNAENLESIRQWQRHYRKQFPGFVIYFDNVPDDVRSKTLRQIQMLGAREEKFFSKAVTHVVTTRPIPPELTSTSPEEGGKHDTAQAKATQDPAAIHDTRKGASLLEAHIQRRTQNQVTSATHDIDPRKVHSQGADILSRARQLGIKIWALEKLHRMLSTILDTDAGDHASAHDTRSHVSGSRTTTRASKDADLEQLLRNEKLTGPTDRDLSVAGQDMTTFRGCYIYVHDMDEKTKPVMVRDYPKPGAKDTGKWPQFKLTGPGRCPFVDDPSYHKRHQQEAAAAKAQEELTAARRTRAASAQQSAPTQVLPPPQALTERNANLRRSPRKADAVVKPLDPPKAPPARRQSSTEGMPFFGSAQQSLRGLPRMVGGEPVASGMQQSNVTSAIRSQYISSTAISSTAPGANHRVGDSKEVSALKRKVLERGASVNSNNSVPSSYMNDVRAALNNDNEPPPRAAKRKAQETLGVVPEDEEHGQTRRPSKQPKPAPRRRKPVERDPKPGYCENCRDKFEDFDEVRLNRQQTFLSPANNPPPQHIQSRKHRKFATTQDNWKELDELLGKLKRPHKEAPLVCA